MVNLRRHFLPWDRPLLPQAVALLADAWAGGAPLDLSRTLVVVATRQSGRRLREALAEHAAAHGQAVLPPRVVLTETLAMAGAPAAGIASQLAGQLAWIDVLRAAPLDEFREVFPVDPPTRDFAWARRLAGQLLRLQATLAEAGLRLADVAKKAGGDFPETARWQQLGALEERHTATLAARGLRDAQAARISAAQNPAPPADTDKIIVLAVPDPLPLAVAILAAHARTLPVEIAVFAPPAEEKNFDDWGRPRDDGWAQREIALPGFEHRVQLCADPAAQAERLIGLVQHYPAVEGALAIGVVDPEVLGPLETGLARAGVPAFNPEGRPRRRDALHALLEALAEFANDDGFAAAAALLRCPDVIAWLATRAGGGVPAAAMLGQLDALHAAHLPPTIAAARERAVAFPVADRALAALAELRGALRGGDFPANISNALAVLFAARRIDAGSPFAESAEAWLEVLHEARQAFEAFPGLTRAESWELALAQFAEGVRFDEKPAGAIELNGWLELLWEDAPHLVVAGLNDGRVPDAIVGDAFLPEALRGRLGLKTNAMRFARDAYLLTTLAASRAAAGRIDLLVGKVSVAGDPLRPSRLLLRCAEAELPARVAFLFRNVEAARAGLPWTRAWQLRPRVIAPPAKISVTALRDWLACPFRFYLKHVLRMEAIDPAKAELDARDFGTLIHAALQELGQGEALRESTDEAMLRDALLEAFERHARARYGEVLTLPLVVQFESARQRLRQAAVVQAAERAAGWRIERVEWPFECALAGVAVRGKIDRIDRHPDGRVRVLDYKTSDAPVSPAEAHLGPVRAAEAERPLWSRAMVGGRPRAWIDLQLPLYRRAVAAEFGPAVECGYFNLPKAVGETAVVSWGELTPELQAAAEECATRVAAAVAAGEFWPPAERSAREDADWPGLFYRGAAASVAWTGGCTG